MKDHGPYHWSLRAILLGLLLAAASALAAGVAGGAGSAGSRVSQAGQADSRIPAGFDLFETDPEQTVFRFRDRAAIPAGFFAPGSKRFEGNVPFGGVPIERFRNKRTGDADTVVQRKSDAILPADGSPSAPVPIELVRLRLVSIASIHVRVGNKTQLWDVRAVVSPSRPSTGQMTLSRSGEGGTFASRLTVYPKFTFTRVIKRRARTEVEDSGSRTRVLDVGALPPGVGPDDASLTFTAQGVPWRRGCIPPALRIQGLNDEFCPGLTVNPTKQLTEHQSTYAKHGIWPVQPRLEHFTCYSVRSQEPPFQPPRRLAEFVDQFRNARVDVTGPRRPCNPARKNAEPLENKVAHLRCYAISGPPFRQRTALVHNQFGPYRLRILTPQRLCVQATKQEVGGPEPPTEFFATEHFQCYRVRSLRSFRTRVVTMRDQFGRFRVTIARPFRLCAPVRITKDKPVQHHAGHLLCYGVSGRAVQRTVRMRDTFTLRRNQGPEYDTVAIGSLREVCVPSAKVLLP
jgi:hypothetical protein